MEGAAVDHQSPWLAALWGVSTGRELRAWISRSCRRNRSPLTPRCDLPRSKHNGEWLNDGFFRCTLRRSVAENVAPTSREECGSSSDSGFDRASAFCGLGARSVPPAEALDAPAPTWTLCNKASASTRY